MKNDIKLRCVKFGQFILENNETIRGVAKCFNVSKSTVHCDLSKRLEKVDSALFCRVKALLEYNFEEKHLRGGLATKNKFIKENKKL